MQNTPTELRIENGEHLVLYVNGKLIGECVLGHWEGRDDLMDRVIRARRLESIPLLLSGLADRLRSIVNIEDHINKTLPAKQQAFARGLMDGLAKKTQPCFAFPGINPDNPPEHTHSYRAGYDYGNAVAHVVRLTLQANTEDRPNPEVV